MYLVFTYTYFFRTISEEKSLTFTTIADPPTSLSLDNSTPSSLTVRWEAAAVGPGAAILKFRLTLECGALGLLTEHSVTGDKNTFNCSKLPDVVGSGGYFRYLVLHFKQPKETFIMFSFYSNMIRFIMYTTPTTHET